MTHFREYPRSGHAPSDQHACLPSTPPYTHAENPFARGRFATIHSTFVYPCFEGRHQCRYLYPFLNLSKSSIPSLYEVARRSDLPVNTLGQPMAVKKIPRQGLTDLFLSPEDQDGMSAAEIEHWSAKIGKLEFTMMKPLLRESVASRDLGGSNPYVLRYIDSFWTTSHLYIISEFAAGGDLKTRMDHRIGDGQGPFSEYELIPMIRVLCSSINYIHRQGWTHGDVNPSNILFRDQSFDRLVLADFSYALKVREEEELEMTSTLSGTAGFRAPQGQARGPQEDMWALGVTCYFLLSNRYPIHFNVDDKNDTAHQVDVEMINWDRFSELARDFMSRLIQLDPDSRMTASQARDHPWLSAYF